MLRSPHQQARANCGGGRKNSHTFSSITADTCNGSSLRRSTRRADAAQVVQQLSRHVTCHASIRSGQFIPGLPAQPPAGSMAQPIDTDIELHTQDEIQLRNAIAAANAPNHPVVMSWVRLTKSMSQFLRLNMGSGPASPFSPSHVRGITQQVEHVIHVLQQHGTQLLPQDLALLAQGCRRLRVISQYVPTLNAQHEALCKELVSVCSRSPKMQHTDMLVWAIYLQGLAAAGVRSKEFIKLLSWVVTTLPQEPLSPVPQSSRSRACARLLWAYAHVGYMDDVTPLLNYVLGAVQAGFMQASSASHCSQLLWSMATLKLPTPQLLELLRDMIPSLAVWGTENPEELNLSVVSGTCFALATAGVTTTDDKGIGGLEDWNSLVATFVSSSGVHAALNEEAAQLHWAAKQMQADWFTHAPSQQPSSPSPPPHSAPSPSTTDHQAHSSPPRSHYGNNSHVLAAQAAAMMGADDTLYDTAGSNGNGALPSIHPELSFLRGTISDEDSNGMRGPDIWRRSD